MNIAQLRPFLPNSFGDVGVAAITMVSCVFGLAVEVVGFGHSIWDIVHDHSFLGDLGAQVASTHCLYFESLRFEFQLFGYGQKLGLGYLNC